MKKRTAILMLTGLAVAALADNPAADSTYFHPAASLYIQGNISAASNLVAQGLAEFPEDGKLKRLKELIEQQQQNEQDQDQQQNEQDQDQQQNEQDQDQQDQQNQDQQNQDQQQDQDQDQDPQDQSEQEQDQPEPQRAEQMSEDEAERLLDAMKQEEKNKRLELHPVMGRPVNVEKDW